MLNKKEKSEKKPVHIVILFFFFFFFLLFPAEAQFTNFKPFTSFRVIKTERFDIIFPAESEKSARLLASYADQVYEQVSSLLGIEVPGRIPVTFSPHTDYFNGYFISAYNHIVLYDTPMDIERTTFADNLKSLFLHELTHAVSLNSRSPFYRVMNRIFGNWVTPTLWNSPLFMVEGVTISFESLDGFGRANDPRVKQYLRQAVHEDAFLAPFQASGMYDRSIQPGGYYYEYGGLFSAWLRQTFGMEKYAELWQAMGRDTWLSLFVYRSGFYRHFRNVYGVTFLDAWNAFGDSFALDNLETNNDELLFPRYRYFSEKEYFLGNLVVRGSNVYFLNSSDRKIGIYNTLTGQTRYTNANLITHDFDVSADGALLLISGYNMLEERAIAVVTESRADTGRRTGRTIQGLYRARYFRDGVIGIRSNLHNNLVVYEDFNGNSEVLFSGNEELMFSGPQALDDERIAVIVSRGGIRELWLYHYGSRELFRIEAEDNTYWQYMRGLAVSDGKLFFSHNADDRMYKLAYIDLDAMQAVFSARDFSGGVFNPVAAGGTVYYRGSFVFGDRLLRFPEPAGSLTGTISDIQFVRLDTEIAAKATIPDPLPYDVPTVKYHGIRYMNPFRYWVPVPLIRLTDDSAIGLRLDGGGLAAGMMDPTNSNYIALLAFADIRYNMAHIEQFSWQNTGLGFPLALSFSDKVIESGIDIYRNTRVTLTGNINWSTGKWYHGFSLGGGYVRNADFAKGRNPYEWDERRNGFYITSGIALAYHRLFTLRLSSASMIDNFAPRLDSMFRMTMDTRFPLQFTLFSSYDGHGMDIHGISNMLGTVLISPYVLTEYSHPKGLELTWLGGGEAAVSLFSLEIQKNFSHVYFNRFFGSLAVRNQIYDSKGSPETEGVAFNDLRLIQSLRLRLGISISFFPYVKRVPFIIEPYITGSWKFSNTITGNGSPWHYSIGITTSFL